MKYNYVEEMKNDVVFYMQDIGLNWDNYAEDYKEDIIDELWTVDTITGNGPDGCYASETECKEFISGNLDLMFEALDEFGVDYNELKNKATHLYRYLDTTIRCYLLPQVVNELWNEYKGEETNA